MFCTQKAYLLYSIISGTQILEGLTWTLLTLYSVSFQPKSEFNHSYERKEKLFLQIMNSNNEKNSDDGKANTHKID